MQSLRELIRGISLTSVLVCCLSLPRLLTPDSEAIKLCEVNHTINKQLGEEDAKLWYIYQIKVKYKQDLFTETWDLNMHIGNT